MNFAELQTQVAQALNGYSTNVLEELDERAMFAAARDALLELRKKLRVPVTEADITLVSGERGINLPSHFLKFVDEPQAMRLSPSGASTEGSHIWLVAENDLYG